MSQDKSLNDEIIKSIKLNNIQYLDKMCIIYDCGIRSFRNEVICHLVAMQLYENGIRASDLQ